MFCGIPVYTPLVTIQEACVAGSVMVNVHYVRLRRPMDFDGDCPQTGRCRRPPMVVIMDTCNSCKAHSVPMTTPASDMYGHTEKHIRYSTSLFNKSPPKFVFLKSHNTSSSPSAYTSFKLPRSSKSMAWMIGRSSPLDRCSGILCLNITIITKITNNTSQVKSRTLSAQLPFSFPLSPLKRQHVTDCASINILPIHLPGGGESGTRQRAAHAARL